MRVLLLCAALALAGCQTTSGRYTGDSTYYWADEKPKDGVLELWSCRDLEPNKPHVCMVDAEWPDGGLSR